jgi:DNA-binding transcriptional LysR family regulator
MVMNQTDNPVDSRQLMAFVALAHGGSLRAAALELMVTESAISHAIRSLEKNLNVQLFHRTGKGLILTASGKLLLGEGVKILGMMRDIRKRIAQAEGSFKDTIRITAATSFIRTSMHDILHAFRDSFPDVEVLVTSADRESSISMLSKGDIDLAIALNMPDGGEDISSIPLFSDELWLLMSPKNPLSRFNVVPLEALAKVSIYMTKKENFSTRLVQQEVSRRSIHLQKFIHISSFEALSEVVRIGVGVAFQSPWAMRKDWSKDEFTFRRVEGLDLRRNWHCAWPYYRTGDQPLETLKALCLKAGDKLSKKLHEFVESTAETVSL